MSQTKTISNVVQSDWGFGLSLMPHLGEGNVSVSPTSMRIALAMLAEGATGATLKQIVDAAHLPSDTQGRWQGFAQLTHMLNAASAPYTLRSANAIWTTKKDPVKDEYKRVLQDSYSAEANDADFGSNAEGERNRINGWVAGKTEQKIPELFPVGSIDASTILVLANALYFKARWNNKFDEKYTEAQPFTLKDGKEVKVPMMRKGYVELAASDRPSELPKFNYGEFDGIQVAMLPYKGEELSTVAFLPPKGTSVTDLEEQLRKGVLNFAILRYDLEPQSFARLEIPKHELKGDYDLVDVLKGVGIDRIFSPSAAELSGIADVNARGEPIYVSAGKHKTYFKTNEEGSEGAAATGFAVARLCTSVSERKEIEFVADRPFLEAIVHTPSGACLFINRVEDPR